MFSFPACFYYTLTEENWQDVIRVKYYKSILAGGTLDGRMSLRQEPVAHVMSGADFGFKNC